MYLVINKTKIKTNSKFLYISSDASEIIVVYYQHYAGAFSLERHAISDKNIINTANPHINTDLISESIITNGRNKAVKVISTQFRSVQSHLRIRNVPT